LGCGANTTLVVDEGRSDLSRLAIGRKKIVGNIFDEETFTLVLG